MLISVCVLTVLCKCVCRRRAKNLFLILRISPDIWFPVNGLLLYFPDTIFTDVILHRCDEDKDKDKDKDKDYLCSTMRLYPPPSFFISYNENVIKKSVNGMSVHVAETIFTTSPSFLMLRDEGKLGFITLT